MRNKEAGNRLAYIDALRGLAAFSVVFQHATEVVWHNSPHSTLAWQISEALLKTVNLGRFGVVLFFIISGFVIPFSLKSGTAAFVESRFFRLYPAFWLCIVLGLLVGPAPDSEPWTAWQIMVNATMLHRLFHVPDMFGHFWTLCCEVLFYAFCVALYLAGKLRSALTVGGISIALLFLAVTPDASSFMLGHPLLKWRELSLFLPFLLLGMLLRLAVVERDPKAILLSWIAIPFALIASPILGGALSPTPEPNPMLQPLACSLGFLMAIIVFVSALRLKPATPGWVWLGKISYSAYLFQGIVLIVMRRTLQPSNNALALLFVAGSIIIVTALASFIYAKFEVPMIDYGRSISGIRRRSLATDVAP